jgi:hypothetical protein
MRHPTRAYWRQARRCRGTLFRSSAPYSYYRETFLKSIHHLSIGLRIAQRRFRSRVGSLAILAAIRRASSRIRASHSPGQIASKNPAGAVLPDRKCSADIIGRCGEYTEGQAAANQGEQHGRFHAVDLLPIDVKLVCEVGHGYSPCNTAPPPFCHQLNLVICIESVTGVTQKTSPLDEHVLMRGLLGPMK